MSEILAGRKKAANILVTYAHFLNRLGIDSDNHSLYRKLLASSNRYAAEASLQGYEPEEHLDASCRTRLSSRASFPSS